MLRRAVQRRVQLKRHEQFEKARRDQKLAKQRVDRALRREILSAARGDSAAGHTVRSPCVRMRARGRVIAVCEAWCVTCHG